MRLPPSNSRTRSIEQERKTVRYVLQDFVDVQGWASVRWPGQHVPQAPRDGNVTAMTRPIGDDVCPNLSADQRQVAHEIQDLVSDEFVRETGAVYRRRVHPR